MGLSLLMRDAFHSEIDWNGSILFQYNNIKMKRKMVLFYKRFSIFGHRAECISSKAEDQEEMMQARRSSHIDLFWKTVIRASVS